MRRLALIHALWVLVLLKLVTPPLIEVPVGLRLERLAYFAETNDGPSEVATPRLESARPKLATTILVAQASDTNPPLRQADSYGKRDSTNELATVETRDVALLASISASTIEHWSAIAIQLLLLVWVAGAILWFAVQGWRIALFARLASTAQLADEEIQQQAERLATKIGLRRVPKIWFLDLTITPLLWTVGWRARVIFPADLLQRVDADARATLMTHELAHYHRGDIGFA